MIKIAIAVLLLLVAACGVWILMRSRTQSSRAGAASLPPSGKSESVGRELRRTMMTKPPREFGVEPTPEFPRVYGILIDWPIDEQIATIFSTSTGAASLYTTSKFGIIGGEAHETVRTAAKKLVAASDRHLADAAPTTKLDYPSAGHVRFYFLTFDGLRVIDADLGSIEGGTSKQAELFDLGQSVMTELRMATDKGPDPNR